MAKRQTCIVEYPDGVLIPLDGAGSLFFESGSMRVFSVRTHRRPRAFESIPREFAAADISHPEPLETHLLPDSMSLSRLTLIMSDRCSLACPYCYAGGGRYTETASQAVADVRAMLSTLAQVITMFDVQRVMFFGGEPSLFPERMLEALSQMQVLREKGALRTWPRMGVVTNLFGSPTRMDEFLAICKEYDIEITASIDGPASVHDKNRPTADGRPSYNVVADNIRLAQKLGLQVGVECTYTPHHITEGISVIDLMKFFFSEFGIVETHIVPVFPTRSGSYGSGHSCNELTDLFCDGIEYSVSHIVSESPVRYAIGRRLVSALAWRQAIPLYCAAGVSEMSVSPSGELFPCFMFTGHSRFSLGLPLDAARFLARLSKISTTFLPLQQKQRDGCKTCWARSLCCGCVGADYLAGGDLMEPSRCDFQKALACEAIVRLAERVECESPGRFGYVHRHS